MKDAGILLIYDDLMVNYRRNYITGGTYFFTVNLYHRDTGLLTRYIDELRHAFSLIKQQHPFQIDAIVILPDHLHTIWTLPEGDDNYPQRWRSIKSQFTRAIKAKGCVIRKNKRGEHYMWQKRYWEHTIRDDRDLQQHIDYIHYNPVKHGHVSKVSNWQYSSFHQYVAKGILDKTWSENKCKEDQNYYGE
jgi:putative transposase